MDIPDVVVWATVTVVVVVTVASGPLVPLNVAGERGEETTACTGGGTATVEVTSVPVESFALSRADYGSEVFLFEGDPVRLEAGDVSGCVRVTVQVELPAANVTVSTVTFITESGQVTLEPQSRFDRDAFQQESYEAVMTVQVDGEETKEIHRTTTVVEVEDGG